MSKRRKEVFIFVIYPFIKSVLLIVWVLPRVIGFQSGPGCGGLISSGKVNLSTSATASTSYNSSLGPKQAFINNTLAWCTGAGDWQRHLEIELGMEYNVTAIGSQDWGGLNNKHLQQFRVATYDSGGSSTFISESGVIKTFIRNPSDQEQVVVHNIVGIVTNKVQFKVYEPSGDVCARFDVYTCWKVNGSFSPWSSWGNCSVSCGNGTQIRSRDCTNPAPANGGATCVGNYNQTRLCTGPPCKVDGNFSSWSSWGNCSASCGNGTQLRSRDCTNPAPAHGGATCVGNYNETRTCTAPPCKIDGGFSAWGNWSQCSVQCGNGTQKRYRTCSNPAPAHGGASCTGSYNETKICVLPACKVDGGFSQWDTWSECSVKCGEGTRIRRRNCSNPVPANGGSPCSGSYNDTEVCVTSSCQDGVSNKQTSNYMDPDQPGGILLIVLGTALIFIAMTLVLYKLNMLYGSFTVQPDPGG